jgi:hypothetical protein
MIYFLLLLSLSANVVLVWYVRKLLSKYWSDVEVRDRFTEMLGQYAEALSAIYKLEEFYGEETIKKAINQTRFVQEACEEYKKILEAEVSEEESATIEETNEDEETDEKAKKIGPIRLKEGEKVTQNADQYKKVVPDIG